MPWTPGGNACICDGVPWPPKDTLGDRVWLRERSKALPGSDAPWMPAIDDALGEGCMLAVPGTLAGCMTGVWFCDALAVVFFSDFFRGGLGLEAAVGVEGMAPLDADCCGVPGC